MLDSRRKYYKLEEIFQQYIILESTIDTLLWDSAVIMPVKGNDIKASQITKLRSIANKIIRSAKIGDLIKQSEDEQLNNWQLANLREMKRLHENAVVIDSKLEAELTKSTLKCEIIWREAKANNDFNTLKPFLQNVINLTKKVAKIKADKFGFSKYESLINNFDPGRKVIELDNIFHNIERELLKIKQQVLNKQCKTSIDKTALSSISIENQKKLVTKIIKLLTFDFKRGRCDESKHPFCRGTSNDARITTRYNPGNFLTSLMSAIHETGHAVYLQNLPVEWQTQPVGVFRNMTIHESQSLFFEFCIGSNYEFIQYIAPIVQKYSSHTIDDFLLYNLINKVEFGFIRTEADEFTYPLHIIHRYKIEKSIIEENIHAADIPEIWNKEFFNMFGLYPHSDTVGCLQDIHWAIGYFGYFPSYCLGSVLAVQLLNKIKGLKQNINENKSSKKFIEMIKWLNMNIHQYGSLYSSNELINKTFSENLNEKYYIQYLNNKFVNEG